MCAEKKKLVYVESAVTHLVQTYLGQYVAPDDTLAYWEEIAQAARDFIAEENKRKKERHAKVTLPKHEGKTGCPCCDDPHAHPMRRLQRRHGGTML